MSDFNRQQPIHPVDCACPRCDPQLLGGRRRSPLQIGLCALIVAASFGVAALAVVGTN